jgi:hypothetical protein
VLRPGTLLAHPGNQAAGQENEWSPQGHYCAGEKEKPPADEFAALLDPSPIWQRGLLLQTVCFKKLKSNQTRAFAALPNIRHRILSNLFTTKPEMGLPILAGFRPDDD